MIQNNEIFIKLTEKCFYPINYHELLLYKIRQVNSNYLTEIFQVLTQMLQIRETYYL